MILSLLFTSPLAFALVAGALTLALSIHEFAHAWVADKLGDPTPRYQGRVTLDPRAHLDPLGTLAILIAGFGWGKPVQFDPYNLKDPVRDTALIALAGPASNLILATLLAIILNLTGYDALSSVNIFQIAAQYILYINVMLAVFNLIPVHPLDGGKILVALLPKETAYEYEMVMRRYGTIILLALILPLVGGRSAVSNLITPIIDFILNILL